MGAGPKILLRSPGDGGNSLERCKLPVLSPSDVFDGFSHAIQHTPPNGEYLPESLVKTTFFFFCGSEFPVKSKSDVFESFWKEWKRTAMHSALASCVNTPLNSTHSIRLLSHFSGSESSSGGRAWLQTRRLTQSD